MLRNVIRWTLLTAFDLTAGLAFVAALIACVALFEVVNEGTSPRNDFLVNVATWTVALALAIGWIYYFSTIRDRVRSYILKEI